MSENYSRSLSDKLTAYKKKYYSNLLLRGLIFTSAIILSSFILINTLEYFGRLNSALRASLFFLFIASGLFSFLYWILNPVIKLFFINQQLSNEEAARNIGAYFAGVNDKLLNTLQLQNNISSNELTNATLLQRTKQLSIINFNEAVKFEDNNKFLKYIFIPALIILFLIIFKPAFFTESSARIVNFSKSYASPAPFSFVFNSSKLDAFKNEDFVIDLSLKGKSIPENIYLVLNGRKVKMQSINATDYKYVIYKIQKEGDFHFEAAGFVSENYSVSLKERPNLLFFDAKLNFPAYLKRKSEDLKNAGNLVIPEGTTVQWNFNVNGAEELQLKFQNEQSSEKAVLIDKNSFLYKKQVKVSTNYKINLKNKDAVNKDEINFYIEVIPDLFPKISLEQLKDTLLFNYLVLGGSISDDYGLTKLAILYKILRKPDNNSNSLIHQINIPINYNISQQNYYYQWALDSLHISPGDKIEYFTQVWDNDGVNGAKITRSPINVFNIPDKESIDKDIDEKTSSANTKMAGALNESQKLKKDIKDLEDRLKSKKSLDFQDKKMIEELLKKKKDLNTDVENLQKDLNELKEKRNKFSDQSPKLSEKIEKLQKLMDQLLDEETKKLYDELKKLLEQNKNSNSNDLLNKLDKKEGNLEKELERALEMFKQLQVEQKTEKEINNLKELAKQQEKLSEESKKKDADIEEIKKEQEALKQKFEEEKKKLEELNQENKKLENPSDIPDTKEEQKEVDEQQKKSEEQLNNKQEKKASGSQKKAANKMKDMADKMEKGMSKEEAEQNQENIDDLRKILENLLSLSFNQEKLMKDFKNVSTSDPKFLKLAQEQLKIKDDGKIIEDSLTALSKRVFQIEAFVTRELGQMKEYMDESIAGIKQRKINIATSKQQLSMTSMNNLALMLDDVLQKMQNQAQQLASGKKSGKKKGPKGSKGISGLQKQLNQKIQELKQGGLSGKQLSEELAKLAQEQEIIRKLLEEGNGGGKGQKGGGKDGKEQLLKDMEETEKDLVNKNINQNTIKRQQEILTRLLDADKAEKEQDEDPARKSEQAKDKKRTISASQFEDYIKQKQSQTELLKTIPPALKPYYKKEVDKYFKKIE